GHAAWRRDGHPGPPQGGRARHPDPAVTWTPLVTVDDYQARARELLPQGMYDYYAGGAGDEWTLRENRAAFERFALRPRVLVDVSSIDPSTELLGERVAMPVLAAPTALRRMAHPDGEVETARGIRRFGTIMTLSTLAS